jgi:uncharacterized protein YukE
MAQIDVNPQRLREFAATLTDLRTVVDEEGARVHRRLDRLSESWRDQEYDQFVEEFQSVMQAINAFCDDVDAAVPLLIRDAEAIENFQSLSR